MTDFVVIFDPSLEMAALLETESLRACGPVGIGPNAQKEMMEFVRLMPDAVLDGTSGMLTDAWRQFWVREFAPLYETPEPSTDGQVVESLREFGDAAAAATIEARDNAGLPPEPAPHDTDTPEPAHTAVVAVTCVACNGVGTVPGVTDGAAERCNLCQGTGKMAQQVPA